MKISIFGSLFSCAFFLLLISFISCIEQTYWKKINSLNEHYYEKQKPDFTWTINLHESTGNETNFTLLSEVFPLKGYSFGAQAQLTLNEYNKLQPSLSYKDLNNSGQALNLELVPSVTYIYKNQQQPSRSIIIRECNFLFTSVLQYDEFYYATWILPFENITGDTISIAIWVEAPEEAVLGYSYDGTLSGTIDNFRLKREMEVEHLVYHVSPYFYTSPKGYRVQNRMYLNGYGNYTGKGLTAIFAFLTGPYDADLSTSFKRNTTVTLFHPTDHTVEVVKRITGDFKISAANAYRYAIDMGSHAEIEPLLFNNTLYYRVEIVPA